MELTAVIKGLAELKKSCDVSVTTDSQYVRKGITEWVSKWKKNGWRTSAKQPVKNSDLWKQLDEETARHTVTWQWVKGHAGHRFNERADQLANSAAAWPKNQQLEDVEVPQANDIAQKSLF